MGKGGSRYGAGRPGWRRKCESSLALDIRRIHQKGLLDAGSWFSWHWTTNYGDKAGSISVRVDTDCVRLNYQWTPYDSDPQQVTCSLRIDKTPCNFGGNRSWFLCPQCGRRCAVVYFGARGGRYACRMCLRLAYLSEAQDGMGRMWRKQDKLAARLGEDGEKPKGMHWSTYERINDQIDDVEQAKDGLFCMQAARMLRFLG